MDMTDELMFLMNTDVKRLLSNLTEYLELAKQREKALKKGKYDESFENKSYLHQLEDTLVKTGYVKRVHKFLYTTYLLTPKDQKLLNSIKYVFEHMDNIEKNYEKVRL